MPCVRYPVIVWPAAAATVMPTVTDWPALPAGMLACVEVKVTAAPLPNPGPAPVMEPPAVPPLATFIVHSPVACEQLTELDTIESVAGLAEVPKIPKTKVAIATAAMRVMAMRMTVASTGEMAFLFFL